MNRPIIQRLGLLGGSFDPPHRAHLKLVHNALTHCELDALWILPTAWPSHRQQPRTPFVHRLAMAQLAFASLERVQVSDLEAQRPAPTYTIDTLSQLRAQFPDAHIRLFIGSDQAAVFDTWHRWPDILAQSELVILTRPGSPLPAASLVEWHNQRGVRIDQLPGEPDPLSSTLLRAHLSQNPLQMPDGLDPRVWRYIQDHHLYRNSHDRQPG